MELMWVRTAKVYDELWVQVIDIADSEALRKRIVRRKGEYFSARLNGKGVFFSTVPIENFDRVASSQDLESRLHDWLMPTLESWGKKKRVRHSRGWGRSLSDALTNQEDDNADKNQENDQQDETMTQNVEPKMVRLVFVEPPNEVISVLEDLGSRIRGDVEDLATTDDGGRTAMVTLKLNASAVKLLDSLVAGEKDPDGRLHLAWRPKIDDV